MPILDKSKLIKSCKRLPYEFDIQPILAEIHSIPKYLWGQQRVKIHQDTQAVFLRGYPAREMRPDEDRPILDSLPHIKNLIYTQFPGKPGKCLVADLKPNGIIHPHYDRFDQNDTTLDDGIREYFLSTLRIHIPLQTHPEVLFNCNGEFFHLAEGQSWLINNHDVHSVINGHPTRSRIHLIVDIHPEPELIDLIESLAALTGFRNDELYDEILSAAANLV